MTWSIIARDTKTGRLGIAAASRFFAVGVRLPFIASGVGAVATHPGAGQLAVWTEGA